MNIIEEKLKPVEGYLMCMYRNSKNGWYELEVGLPINWVIKETKEINCEIIETTDKGVIIHVFPKSDVGEITLDNLIDYISHVITINKKVQEKEMQLNQFLEEEKKALQEKVNRYYSELESMKHSSFDEISFDEKNSKKSTKKVAVEKPESKIIDNKNIVENGEEKKE